MAKISKLINLEAAGLPSINLVICHHRAESISRVEMDLNRISSVTIMVATRGREKGSKDCLINFSDLLTSLVCLMTNRFKICRRKMITSTLMNLESIMVRISGAVCLGEAIKECFLELQGKVVSKQGVPSLKLGKILEWAFSSSSCKVEEVVASSSLGAMKILLLLSGGQWRNQLPEKRQHREDQQTRISWLECLKYHLRRSIAKRMSKGNKKCQPVQFACVILILVKKSISYHVAICSIQTASSLG
jgi:hypothetical protein